MHKDSKILVTGAGGLVGSAVMADLRAHGYLSAFGVSHQRLDLMDPRATYDYFAEVQPQYVIHTAATVYGIGGNMQFQGRSFYENTIINCNVIEMSRAVGVKKITVMGTGAVYPEIPNRLYEPGDIFMGPPHASEEGYAHAKRGMLAMLEAYHDSYGMDWAFIISCNLFGPGDKFHLGTGHVVPSLIRKFYEAVHSGGNVIVWGDGSAQRDFLYSKDAARAVRLVASEFCGPINMGSGHVFSIKEIVRILTKISGIDPARVLWDRSKPNGQAYRGYDLNDLQDGLGFEPKWTVPQALAETWDWYKDQQEEPRVTP